MIDSTTTYYYWHEVHGELDDSDYEALSHYLDNEHQGTDSKYDEETVERFRNDYIGIYDDLLDFVTQTFNDSNDIPVHLEGYIDYKAIERDWRHSYWISEDGHVFRNS